MRTRLLLLALAAAPTAALAQPAPAKPPAPKPAQKPADKTVGEIVVTGQAPTVQTSIDRRSYSVSADLQAQTGSISDALRNVPAVQVDVQGNVSLRGDSNVTILVDGKPSAMFEGDNKAQSLQALPANQIERVEVITNPSAEFRADGTGGVINLVTKKARGAGRTASAKLTGGSAGRIFGSASTGYNSKNLSVIGDVNIRHDSQKQFSTDERQTPDPSGGFDTTTQVQDAHSTLDISNLHGAVDYDLDDKTRLSADLRGAYVDFTVGGPSLFTETSPSGGLTSAFQRDLDLHQLRSNAVASTTLRRKLGDPGHEFTLNLTYDVTNDDRVRAGHTASTIPVAPESFDRQELNYDYRRTELKGDYVRPMGPGTTLKAGFDLQFDDNSYENTGLRGPSRPTLAPDPALSNLFLFEQSISQAYVTYERPFGDLTVLAGLRIEDVRIDLDQATRGQKDQNNYTKAYPTLHLGWKLDEDQQLTASYSRRVQRPNPLQFNTFPLFVDPLNIRAGNAHLKPQETQSFELGYEYRASPSVYLATLYYRENTNGFADVTREIPGGVFLTTTENVTRSRAAGLELVANGRFSKSLTYNVSTNLFWTEIEPQLLGSPETRSAVSASGRGNLTWQATPKDLFQLNGFLNGKQLNPQGYIQPFGGLNLGYRHKLNDRLAFVLTVQDIAHTFKFRQVIDTPTLKARLNSDFDSRQFQAGFSWTFGGKARDPGFDFNSGGGGGPPA